MIEKDERHQGVFLLSLDFGLGLGPAAGHA